VHSASLRSKTLRVMHMQVVGTTVCKFVRELKLKEMELENVIVSKVSQTQKTKNSMFSLICSL
jgi:hypothetical protein